MASGPTIFDEPHHQSLELLCARALASGDIATAFRLADRRCRIAPLPQPHCFVLRAEALFRMGEKAAAVGDIVKALEIAPDDLAANRRMLAWGDALQRDAAAVSLIANDRDFEVLRHAIATLRGRERSAFANLKVMDAAVRGWAAWQDGDTISITVSGETDNVTTTLAADPSHPLAAVLGHAVEIELLRPSREAQVITVATEQQTVLSLRTPRLDGEPARARSARSKLAASDAVTVIVPVYADYAATKACLDSLVAHLGEAANHRVIIVNDATAEPRIEKLLARIARRPRFQLLTNASNLGFVGSVNRALDHVEGGDIILLNADTVVPERFIERLAAAAHQSADIGTVTPLSNNGEFTSFPVPYRANPLPPATDLAAIDRVAANANAGKVVDIPNGIGFCLYVTRACLDAVGELSEHYHRGYLEDVDLCLRARESGYRNVCAPSIFVGHAGSRSFGGEKRSLVVRNLGAIERRFPSYRAECAAFVKADPLRDCRAAIERKMPAAEKRPRLIVTGTGSVGDVVGERARKLHASAGEPVLIVTLRYGAGGMTAAIADSDGALPQSLRFDLASAAETADMFDYLRSLEPSRVEFADPANTPDAVVAGLVELRVPYDILVADAGLSDLSGRPQSASHGDAFSAKPPRLQPVALSGRGSVTETPNTERLWSRIARDAAAVFAPDADAEAFAARLLPRRNVIRLPLSRQRARGAKPARRKSAATALGIVPLRASMREQRLVHEIARQLNAWDETVSITIVGGMPDDLDLMRLDRTFVTGPVAVTDLPEAVRAYGLQSLFLCSDAPLFGHPLQAAAADCRLPIAYFDWANRRSKSAGSDLMIDPDAPADQIADALGRWMSRR